MGILVYSESHKVAEPETLLLFFYKTGLLDCEISVQGLLRGTCLCAVPEMSLLIVWCAVPSFSNWERWQLHKAIDKYPQAWTQVTVMQQETESQEVENLQF